MTETTTKNRPRTLKQAVDAGLPASAGNTPTVHQAVAAVMAEVGPVGKDSVNEQQRFKFRGIDALVNAVSPIMARHGVLVIPTGVDIIDTSERTTQKGSAMFHVIALYHYTVYGPAGDTMPVTMTTEALDLSDKAMSKMATQAYKYVLAQVFAIPFAGVEDADRETLDRPATPTAEQSLARIALLAETVGQDEESLTARFREKHGGISMEAFRNLDDRTLAQFVTSVEAYLQAQKEARR